MHVNNEALNMSVRPRPNIAALAITAHGGPNHAELEMLGLDPSTVIDFSVNTNPYGPPEEVLQALTDLASGSVIARYPDSECLMLRRALANLHGLQIENILAGNGSAELIWCIAQAYLDAGDTTMIVVPTFGEYAAAAQVAGARVIEFRASESDGYRPNIEALSAAIRSERPRVVWMSTPNNPVGYYLQQSEVKEILDVCKEAGALLVLDEAYINFVGNAWNTVALLQSGHLILLRSMTKDYALAGIRLGYVLAESEIVEMVRRVRPPWSVNVYAQVAGMAALEAGEQFLRSSRRALIADMAYLTGGLRRFDLYPLPTYTNFYIIDVGDAAAMRSRLLPYGLLVRNCASFGLPRYIRLAVRPQPETRRLLDALQPVCSELR